MTDLNAKFELFLSYIDYYFNVSFPLVRRKVFTRNSDKGKIELDDEAMMVKDQLRSSYLESKDLPSSHILRQRYLGLKKLFRNLILILKSDNVAKQLKNSSNKSKTLWGIVNKSRGSQIFKEYRKPAIRNNVGEVVNDPSEVCNIFNNYFLNIGDKFDNASTVFSSSVANTSPLNSFFLSPTTPKEVAESVNSMRTKYSAGLDGISSALMKKVAQELAEPLCDLINHSFSIGTFPDCLKLAMVTPLHKKDAN